MGRDSLFVHRKDKENCSAFWSCEDVHLLGLKRYERGGSLLTDLCPKRIASRQDDDARLRLTVEC